MRDAPMRMALLLALVFWATRPAFGATPTDDTMTTTEFPLRADWDISRQGSRVQLDFTVSDYRIYQFMIEFKHPSDSDRAAAQAFIGSGQLVRVSTGSAKSAQPQVMTDLTQEERDFMAAGGMPVTRSTLDTPEGRTRVVEFINRAGTVEKTRTYRQPPSTWIYTAEGAGITVPVALRLQNLQSPPATLLNDTLPTQGTVDGGHRRQITGAALRPGRYHLDISTTENHPLPEGLQSGLLVTYNPNVMPADR